MIKTELNKGADEKFIFDQTKRSLFGASSLQLMEGVYNKYSQWDCGKRSTDGGVLPCVGLCLGTAILETDLVTPSSDRLDTDTEVTPPLVSKIHDVRLLNPVTGTDLTTKLQTEKLEWSCGRRRYLYPLAAEKRDAGALRVAGATCLRVRNR